MLAYRRPTFFKIVQKFNLSRIIRFAEYALDLKYRDQSRL